ncbi:anti-phage deoxyguanosine triphosphatase [Marinomonas algarum]|uniref:Deoxyguanosinetriphosphate triphosphohydrolase-like protein n=1 Tax=Marinomonas algarum TaxID=2883105 RepID=A0A9X1LEE8_9GAMM|nr:anti-phage deoxyguanosine triphosphatase [Marinomonas algarum]MCB5161336.1 deoxyguanosinetriphosphate triphosphohydrolase family protein [Marinomonas algarum]
MTTTPYSMSTWHERQSGPKASRQNDYRTPYQRDRARIIHSAAFRRLQSKTQILAIRQNDYSRTRLTHSLEVAQIGSGIAHQLKHSNPVDAAFQDWLADDALIETVCLSHDIGHPPFGHGGEVALNYMMRSHGGFEGNAQSLRILGKRGSYSPTFGMDVTRRTLLGILKYPVTNNQVVGHYPADLTSFRQLKASDWAPPKCVYQEEQALLDWVLTPFSASDKQALQETIKTHHSRHAKAQHASFDTSIMDLADDIAYGVHDLEDAVVLGMVTKETWLTHLEPELAAIDTPFLNENLNTLRTQLFSRQSHLRKEAIGSLVSWFITSCQVTKKAQFEHPLLDYQVTLPIAQQQALSLLKQFEMEHIIQRPEVQMLVYKGQQMLLEMFEAYSADPERLLPQDIAAEWRRNQEQGHSGLRIICDYMASMTDDYASRMYNKLFVPSSGSVFDPM